MLGMLLENQDPARVAYEQFRQIFNTAMPILIAVVLAFGLVYSIILGVQFAKAEETDARDKAKQHLINVIIGVVVAAVIMAVIYAVLPAVLAGNYTQNLPELSSAA